jgi:DNA-binding NarL/FixJ family response regulator
LKVLIADGHRLTLDGMRFALERAGDMEVVGVAASGAELLAALKRTEPEVVLMDADLPDMDGLKCLGLIKQNYPGVKVGMLFLERDLERIEKAMLSGALACVMKNVRPEDLPTAVRQVVEATVFTATPAAVPAVVGSTNGAEPQALEELTERELTMLRSIARGLSNKAISREEFVTEQTVKFHLNNVYRKLGVPNRTAAARFAFQHGIVEGQVGSGQVGSGQVGSGQL